jgi:hypothetical protein
MSTLSAGRRHKAYTRGRVWARSAATPLILIAGMLLILIPIAAFMIWLVLSLYNWAV